MLLLSAVYSGEEKKVYLKFYDPKDNVIYHWRDRTDHKPYCYTKMEFADQAEQIAQKETKYTLEYVKKRDIILDKQIDVLKVLAPDPLSIGGTDNSFREKVSSWEADIKYHENYLYDRSLIPGLYYVRKDEQITPYEYPISEKVQFALKSLLWDKIKEAGESGKEYRQYITNWANLLNQPIPELKRVAVDIEVETEEGRMPNPRDHDRRVTAVGLVASDGFRKVLVLANNTPSTGEPLIPEAEPCQTEKELLEKAFRIINEYPIVLTFNGDDFDLPYLYARSQDSRIDPNGVAIPKEKVPIMVKKESFIKRGMQAEPVGIRHGIHIDLYRTFDNRSIQIYAFSRAYTEHTLNAISEALLGDTKIEFEGDISDLPIQRLAEYCLKDADLTYRLTSFNDNLLMRLLVAIARIGRLSVDDIARFGVNQWIRGILYYEHRQRNELIPSRSELEAKGKASTTAVIKEKKYRGGEVVEPTAGIHFEVVVMDFACFDDQTEILTKDGWKNYDTLKQGDIGLSVNLDTGAVEEDPIQKIFKYDIDDIVYRIKTPRKLDFIFTPNHRMVYRTKKGGNNWIWKDRLEVKPLNEITNYHYSLPCFGRWKGKVSYYQTIDNYTFDTNTWLEFIGRFVGDGSFGMRTVQISENSNHHDKIESLCAIIKKLGFEPHIHKEGSKNSVNITIHNKQFTDALKSIFGDNLNSHNKRIPKCYTELSSEHLEYLLKGLMESDGSTSRSGEKTFATVSKQLADDFQLVALKCGYNCVVIPRISNGFEGKYPYYLCILSGFRNKKASFVISRQNPNHVSKEHYTGRVWCASTRNTTLIIRRNGRVIVTGNSLYPSIIKVHNLSYETINCPHKECAEAKIEGTTHWVCKQRKGLTSLLIGSLRDLRVNYYKHLAKDKTLPSQERQLYNVVSQAIKVILNAAYGVMGAEIFPLYCLPVADAIAAIGRSTIHKAIDKCKEIGIEVVYSDTDSLFLKNPSPTAVDEVAAWARNTLGVDLEVDKEYRYVVFSDLKKNYLGVKSDGTVDVKGLTGKKSHTPPFIRKAFYDILMILGRVNSEKDFESAKENIKNVIMENAKNLEAHKIPLPDLSFNVMINKSLSTYGKKTGSKTMDGKSTDTYKGLPQHIKAAKMLADKGRELRAGDVISYVKIKNGEGVKPVELASPEEIDTEKYLETMESTFEQVLSALNFDFKSVLGKPRQQSLDELFWSKPAT